MAFKRDYFMNLSTFSDVLSLYIRHIFPFSKIILLVPVISEETAFHPSLAGL